MSAVRSSSYNRDHVVGLILCIVVAAVLVQEAGAAPTPQEDVWWYNVCDSNGQQQLHQNKCNDGYILTRKSRNILRRAVKLFTQGFKNELKDLKKVYSMEKQKVMKSFKEYNHITWLPTFETRNKSKEILLQFHEQLQKYAATMHFLSKIKLETQVNCEQFQENRKTVLNKISKQIKRCLCEIEFVVNSSCQVVPHRISPNFPVQHGLEQHMTVITELHLLDEGVLQRMSVFVKNSKHLPNILNESDEDNSELDPEDSSMPSVEADGE